MVVQLKKFRHHSHRMCSTGKSNMNVCVTHGFVCVKATEVQVFLCTSLPSLALPLTMQYGTPILRHRAGKNTTSYRWQIKPIMNRQQSPHIQIKPEAKTILKRIVTEMLLRDIEWLLLRVKKLVFLIFILNSGEEIQDIIADNHNNLWQDVHSVQKERERNKPQWDPHRVQ